MATRNDHDGAWKKALQRYFRPFLAFFFPDIEADVDWQHAPEFLDREMGRIARSARLGPRRVDILVRLRLRNGAVTCVLLHVEVQGTRDTDFARRMWVYYYRVQDLHGEDVASLAVLADPHPDWRPCSLVKEQWGCRLDFRFRTAKLTDHWPRVAELEADPNPSALFVAAHLHAQATRPGAPERLASKLRLVRGLYDRGLTREELLELFECVDWFLALTPALERKFCEEITRFEEEKSMSHVTSVEKVGFRKGRQEGIRDGRQESLLQLLEIRFGPLPPHVPPKVAGLRANELETLFAKAVTATSMAELSLEG